MAICAQNFFDSLFRNYYRYTLKPNSKTMQDLQPTSSMGWHQYGFSIYMNVQ